MSCRELRLAAQEGLVRHDEIDLVGVVVQGLTDIVEHPRVILATGGKVDHGRDLDPRIAQSPGGLAAKCGQMHTAACVPAATRLGAERVDVGGLQFDSRLVRSSRRSDPGRKRLVAAVSHRGLLRHQVLRHDGPGPWRPSSRRAPGRHRLGLAM